jgi:hypothetical protein
MINEGSISSSHQPKLKKYQRPSLFAFGTVQDITAATPTDGMNRRLFLRNATLGVASLAAATSFGCHGVS